MSETQNNENQPVRSWHTGQCHIAITQSPLHDAHYKLEGLIKTYHVTDVTKLWLLISPMLVFHEWPTPEASNMHTQV